MARLLLIDKNRRGDQLSSRKLDGDLKQGDHTLGSFEEGPEIQTCSRFPCKSSKGSEKLAPLTLFETCFTV